MDCVTILIVTYNQKEYIYQAIDSVLMQDYGKMQIIISDDCSPFFSIDEIKKYIEKNKRENICSYIVLKNESNLGTVKNLNQARKHISGKYTIPLSGDDAFYDHNVVSKYVEAFQTITDADIIVSQVVQYDKDMQKPLFNCLSQKNIDIINLQDNHRLYGEVCMSCFIPAIGCAYSSEMLERIGLYDEQYYLVEDWPTYLKMLRCGVQFRYYDFISAKHRDGGVSHVKKNRADEREDLYHQDLLKVIQNEILPNYKFAEKSIQHKVYVYANDRAVISQYRKEFKKMSLKEKVDWIWKNKNLPAVFIRGCARRLAK